MNLQLFLSTFGLVFLSELPDKTALTVLVMSAKENPPGVFTGAAAAFVVQSAVAILFGSLLSLLPPALVHRLAGAMFWIFAVMMVLKKNTDKSTDAGAISSVHTFWKSAWSAFVIIFLMEWGDLSQLTTATLVAKYREPVLIFFASVLALWSVTAVFALLGHGVRQKLRPEMMRYVAAAAFALIGTFLFFRP